MKISDKELKTIIDNSIRQAVAKFGDDGPNAVPMYRDDPAVRLHAMLYAALGIAAHHGHSRLLVATRLGISEDAIDRAMGPKTDRSLHSDYLAFMLFSPEILGPEAHGWLAASMVGRLTEGRTGVPAGRLALDVCGIMGDVGDLAGLVHDAVRPDSEGGARVTAREAEHIEAARAGVLDAVVELVPEVEGVCP